MYLPRHFQQDDPQAVRALLRAHPMGTWVTQADGDWMANPLPWLFDDAPEGDTAAGYLRGHVARANPVWRGLATDGRSLVIFQGEQGYVSPGWYPSKREHGKVVPTWNYAMVQCRGAARAIDDRAWKLALVSRLTARHESAQAQPWSVGDAPADYLDSMLGAIVGVEIRVEQIAAKFKLSQNRSAADRQGVIDGLRSGAGGDSPGLAAQMTRYGPTP